LSGRLCFSQTVDDGGDLGASVMAMQKCLNTSVCQDASDDDQPCGGVTDTSVRRRREHSSASLDGPPDGDTERAPSEGVSDTFNVQAI